jgi:transcriptional regulator with XRE-family HTH domain
MSLIHVFAINLKKYRTQQNLSQEKLAELSGLHRTYISAIEREQRNISIENLENIASALNIDAYQLLVPDNK